MVVIECCFKTQRSSDLKFHVFSFLLNSEIICHVLTLWCFYMHIYVAIGRMSVRLANYESFYFII